MAKKNQLIIKNLSVSIEGKVVVNNISLAISAGELHVIMGPNGSGKSSLVNGIMGHPNYKAQSSKSKVKSSIYLNGEDIIDVKPEERARKGLMLGFQNPVSIPGVSISNFLRTAYKEIKKDTKLSVVDLHKKIKEKAKFLRLDESFLKRSINDGFSGGEKKKAEMLQILTLQPTYVMLDEIDTGLDIDALKAVALGIKLLKKQGTGILLITHYQRILKYLDIDAVHIMKNGKLVKKGGEELISFIEKKGYAEI